MGDDRTAEERLADELAAELEAEFGSPDEGTGETAEPPPPPKAPAPEKPIEPSKEAVAKAKEQAKGAKEGDLDTALDALSAKSATAYTRHPIVSVLGHVDLVLARVELLDHPMPGGRLRPAGIG
ncbi:MAG: hypothetical protein ABR562_03405 [Thermoplasmatota archaeon]